MIKKEDGTMNFMISKNGHKIYGNDDVQCVCIDFDYWGTPATLQVPYAKYRWYKDNILLERDKVYEQRTQLPGVVESLFDCYLTDRDPFPVIDDKTLQKKLEKFKDDKTGRENTNILVRCGSPAALMCRDLSICYLGRGYFDLGNAYEMAIICLEATNIDEMDPTVRNKPLLKLGVGNASGRFYNYGCFGAWTSSCASESQSWYVNSDCDIQATYNHEYSLGTIPSRVIY